MFQEPNTPPSRCCWRCGCAMSCVSLITADIDQACSSSALLPAWRRISRTYQSKFLSKSILVRRGRRELCKRGSSQSFGRGWLSFTTPVLAWALFSFTSVNVGLHGMANSGHSDWWGHEFCCSGCRSGHRGAWVVWTASRASRVRVSFPGASSPQLHLVEEIGG